MLVPVIMGSISDLDHGRRIAEALGTLGIQSELRVASAHKATRYLLDLLEAYEASGRARVYITVAGRSNALGAVVDANVTAPVITCPPYSDRFGGADIFSSLLLPSGVAPAVVLDPSGAALLAAKILAQTDPDLARRIGELQDQARRRIAGDDQQVQAGQGRAPGCGS